MLEYARESSASVLSLILSRIAVTSGTSSAGHVCRLKASGTLCTAGQRVIRAQGIPESLAALVRHTAPYSPSAKALAAARMMLQRLAGSARTLEVVCTAVVRPA